MVPALDKIQILKNFIFSINQHLKREVYMVAEMKKDVNLLVRVEDLTTFSDNVLFESKDDVVFLNFTQTIPTPGGDNGKEISQAKLVSRVVLTIPHFLRFADVCESIAKQIKELGKGTSR
jgi:hypothetical protein